MLNREQPKVGITSIIYDLTDWDYKVGHSGVDSLDITITKNGEEVADVTFSDEEIKIYRKRELTGLEEMEMEIYMDDLIWEDEFSSFAHLSTLQVEYHRSDELVRMMENKYQDDLLFVRHNENEEFMGYLEEVSVRKIDGSETLFCYFSPIDEGSEIIRTTVKLKPDVKAIATANSIKVEGAGDLLEISRHVEHIH